jgi:hypothetical protein
MEAEEERRFGKKKHTAVQASMMLGGVGQLPEP